MSRALSSTMGSTAPVRVIRHLFVSRESNPKLSLLGTSRSASQRVASLGFASRKLLYTAASTCGPYPLDTTTEIGHAAFEDGQIRPYFILQRRVVSGLHMRIQLTALPELAISVGDRKEFDCFSDSLLAKPTTASEDQEPFGQYLNLGEYNHNYFELQRNNQPPVAPPDPLPPVVHSTAPSFGIYSAISHPGGSVAAPWISAAYSSLTPPVTELHHPPTADGMCNVRVFIVLGRTPRIASTVLFRSPAPAVVHPVVPLMFPA